MDDGPIMHVCRENQQEMSWYLPSRLKKEWVKLSTVKRKRETTTQNQNQQLRLRNCTTRAYLACTSVICTVPND
jgi:hypothetical protein